MSRTVTDELGKVHTLERLIGRGGQGEVWLVEGGRRVAKLLTRAGDGEAMRRQIAWLKRLDITDLHVARPLAVLRAPATGYVSEFLEEMVPIRTLIRPGRAEKVPAWYRQTGSLRRRLRLLAHAAETISALHARGLVYGDVSHENVFVSESTGALEAWLIDLDNLRHDSDPGRTFYTLGYGAPEILDGSSGATSMSDAWAFAVLVFHVLSLIHPFHGDIVEDGEPEMEEEANAARLPWVEHPQDSRNRTRRGIPRESVLTKGMREGFAATFEIGVKNVDRRATVASWVDRLHQAADGTVPCPGCGSTAFVMARACPFCDAAMPPSENAYVFRWVPGKGIMHSGRRSLGAVEHLALGREAVSLLRRHTHAELGVEGRRQAAVLEVVDRGVRVRPSGATVWVSEPGKQDAAAAREVSAKGVIVPLATEPERSHVLHFGPMDTPHCALVLARGRR